ncbi:hypothetical protein AB0C07_22105 [Actinoplanes missouriensis]|uniref:hypothetical protein n=1 Tax=Actinoplanes missouriensis TaxID=1866 RepID=UPI0033DB0867
MSLTGAPLILLAGGATIAVAVLAVWGWRRGGRLRPVTRTLGILIFEVLTVTTAGLVVNRHEQFYPTWQALRGDTGTLTVTSPVRAGELGDDVPVGPFAWRPAGVDAWQLAGPPVVTVPEDYAGRTGVAFPVVVALVAPGTGSRRTPGAVTVTIAPTARTTVSALLSLPAALGRDVRVSGSGWDVTGGGALGVAFVDALPAGFADHDRPLGTLPPALAAPVTLPS